MKVLFWSFVFSSFILTISYEQSRAADSIAPDSSLGRAIAARKTAKGGAEIIASFKQIQDLGIESIGDLKTCAKDDSLEDHIRESCMVAIGKSLTVTSDTFFIPYLQTPLKHTGDGVKDTAAVSLRMKAAMEFGRSRSPKALPFLKAMLTEPGWDMSAKDGAAFGLAQLDDKSGVGHAVQSIIAKTFTSDISLNALILLRERAAIPKLRAAMAGKPTYEADALRKAAIRIDLAGRDQADSVRILKSGMMELDEKSLLARWIAFELVRIGTPDAIQTLREFGQSKNKNIAWESRFALQQKTTGPGTH